MKFFGPHHWGDAIAQPQKRCSTPVGALCSWCEEPIAVHDFGVVLPYLSNIGAQIGDTGRDFDETISMHRECHVRCMVGSVAHQNGVCSCHGGTDDDPPGMSKRDSAHAAMELFEKGGRDGR